MDLSTFWKCRGQRSSPLRASMQAKVRWTRDSQTEHIAESFTEGTADRILDVRSPREKKPWGRCTDIRYDALLTSTI